MNLLHKHIALSILLFTLTSSATIQYKTVLTYTLGGIAAATTSGIAGNYFYDHLTKTANQQAIDQGLKSVRTIQEFLNTVTTDFAYELNIISTKPTNAHDAEVFEKLYKKISEQFSHDSCYHYATMVHKTLKTLQKHQLTCLQLKTNLQARLEKVEHDARYTKDQRSQLILEFGSILRTINDIEVSLQSKLKNVSDIHYQVTHSAQYSFDYQQARLKLLEQHNTFFNYQPYIINHAKPTIVLNKISSAPIALESKTQLPRAETEHVLETMAYDPQIWCDRTDPFNS